MISDKFSGIHLWQLAEVGRSGIVKDFKARSSRGIWMECDK
jgi:hypothetical protein